MRALILSDIHANLEALNAVLDAVRPGSHAASPARFDALWNLGDTVGYGGSPNQVIDRIRPLSSLTVRGNHDRVCCGLSPATNFNPVARAAVTWTRKELTGTNLAWLRDLPQGPLYPHIAADNTTAAPQPVLIGAVGVRGSLLDAPLSTEPELDLAAIARAAALSAAALELSLEQQPASSSSSSDPAGVALAHGSPLHEDHYILNVRDAWAPLQQSPAPVTFIGHTHVQGGFALAGSQPGSAWHELRPCFYSRTHPETWSYKLLPGNRHLINPGSVGQPRDNDWRAAFAIYDTDAAEITFHRVPYDVTAAQGNILMAGLPERLAARLREGR